MKTIKRILLVLCMLMQDDLLVQVRELEDKARAQQDYVVASTRSIRDE